MTINRTTIIYIFTALTLFTSAQALAFTVAETHFVNISSTPTPWNQTVSLPLYDGAATLMEVRITLEGKTDSSVDFLAIQDLTILNGNIGAEIKAANFDNSATMALNVLPQDTFAPPSFSLSASSAVANVPVQDTKSTMVSLTNTTLTDFMGSGNFSVDISADGTQGVQTSGGNYDLTHRTNAETTIVVEYLVVPEPQALLAFPASLLIGLILLRRSGR